MQIFELYGNKYFVDDRQIFVFGKEEMEINDTETEKENIEAEINNEETEETEEINVESNKEKEKEIKTVKVETMRNYANFLGEGLKLIDRVVEPDENDILGMLYDFMVQRSY